MKPTTIKTDERIFKVEDYDGNTYLCNLDTAPPLHDIRKLWHLWDFQFESFGKKDLNDMLELAATTRKDADKARKKAIREDNEFQEWLEIQERKHENF